jgi:hypothetical protein
MRPPYNSSFFLLPILVLPPQWSHHILVLVEELVVQVLDPMKAILVAELADLVSVQFIGI